VRTIINWMTTKALCLGASVLMLCILALDATGQAVRTLEYEYDAAGNLIRIVPTVTGIIDEQENTLPLRVFPSPIAVPANGEPTSISFRLESPFESGQVFQVALIDATLAILNTTEFTIPAGEISFELQVTGLIPGGTRLIISQTGSELGANLSLFVESVAPLQGEQFFLDANASTGIGVFYSRAPGVVDNTDAVASKAVGVLYSQPPASTDQGFAVSAPVGVTTLPLVVSNDTNQLAQGSSATITLTGLGLNAVASLEIYPANDIVIDSITSNPGGTQLVLQISVVGVAAQGLRQLNFTSVNGGVTFENSADQFIEITN